jgi:hypothetical protein
MPTAAPDEATRAECISGPGRVSNPSEAAGRAAPAVPDVNSGCVSLLPVGLVLAQDLT